MSTAEVDWGERKALDIKHLADPQVGDYWHEMFTPVCVVIGRRNDEVLICESTREVDPDHWTWDLGKTRWISFEEFSNYLRYNSPSMSDRTWCSVIPKSHEWARGVAIAEQFGE